MITHIGFATIYVADQQRSLDFYVTKMGFTVDTDAEMGPGKRWLELSLPGSATKLVVSKAEDFETVVDTERGVDFALACDDVKSTYDDLVAKGVVVSPPVIEPWGSFVQVTDPDGYEIFVSQTED
jgi:lactoylglutathione lyase